MWTLLIIMILAACTFSAKSFTITSTRHMFSYGSSILKFLISFATVVSIQICKRVLWSTGGCIGGSWRCSDSSRSSCCDVSCGCRSRWTYLRKNNQITNRVAIKTDSKWMFLINDRFTTISGLFLPSFIRTFLELFRTFWKWQENLNLKLKLS